MRIKIWGCRGSLVTPGPHTLRYGGNTTCLEVRDTSGHVFVIDAGSGARGLGKALLNEPARTEITFLFTHSHWDHIVGFPFFAPAYLPKYRITLCGGPRAKGSFERYLTRQMAAPYFPVDFHHLQARFAFGRDWPQPGPGGSLAVEPIVLNHPNGGFGFRFTEAGRSFVFLTDNELGFVHPGGKRRADYTEFCRGADLLIHDAQYTEAEYRERRGWGHSSYADAVDLALAAGARRLLLFHHDPDRTDEDLDEQAASCRRRIAAAGSSLECDAAREGMEVTWEAPAAAAPLPTPPRQRRTPSSLTSAKKGPS